MFQNLGASTGGIISLVLNLTRNYRGSVSKATYIVFMTIMCLGGPFALALPAAHKVERSDGRKVVLGRSPNIAAEFKVFWKLFKHPAVLAQLPLMLYAQWFLGYQWQFNYLYFTVRARALNSMLFYLIGFLASGLLGQLLDWQRFSRQWRAKAGCLIVFFGVGISWIIGQAVQVKYARELPTLDWETEGFGLGCFVFLLWGASDPL